MFANKWGIDIRKKNEFVIYRLFIIYRTVTIDKENDVEGDIFIDILIDIDRTYR